MIPKPLARTLLTAWARTGKAPGWLYALIERNGQRLHTVNLVRELFNGVRLECDLRQHIQQQIYFFGAYEPIGTDLLLSLIPEGGTVVDAGANVGYYTLMMGWKVGRRGAVHSFEPIPDNLERLRRNLELNGRPEQIKVNPLALWNRAETLQFSLERQHEFNSGGYAAVKARDALRSFSCESVTLDQYLREHGARRLDAIKMDIEGAEKFALEGARETLARHRPVVFLEVCRGTCERFGYTPAALWALFEPHGYRAYRIESTCAASGWVRDFSGIEQSNVLLIPESRASELDCRWNDKTIRRGFLRYRWRA